MTVSADDGRGMIDPRTRYQVGVDVGGTFVDFALRDVAGEVTVHKVPVGSADLAGSILRGFADIAEQRGTDTGAFLKRVDLVVHGTTVATNAVLTGTGSRTALLTTKGTRDALEMRRGIKERPLDNKYEAPPPLVPRYLRLAVDERVDWRGGVLKELDTASLEAAVQALKAHEVEAVAVCLMHAYANDRHEREAAARLREALPDAYLTVSSELLPQLGYYSRVSTAVLNSYVGPLLRSYVLSLAERLADAGFGGQLLVMNSAAGLMAPPEIISRAAAALLSGPAAAPVAARVYAAAGGASDCAIIDMGGTSLDISLASEGEPLEVTEGRVGRYATALPMIDIRTIGAGGGSIARVDAGGGLQVGPQSAGAAPGPACYGKGGTLPTCTDVDLLLGYLDADYFLGGRMRLSREPAERAVREHLAEPLGISVEEAAVAAFEVVNAGMASGIRDMIVDHGLDPEAMPMVVGGGAGPVHGAAAAMELGIREVIVPRQSGVFCAVGMLFADLKHDLVRSYCASSEQLDAERWRDLFTAMAEEGRRTLVSEGAHPEEVEVRYSADLRYLRQVHGINLPVDEASVERLRIDDLHGGFDAFHERLFGYRLPEEVLEVVNLRVRCLARRARPELLRVRAAGTATPAPDRARRAYSPGEMSFREFPVYRGETLDGGSRLEGPVIVELPQTTLVVPSAFAVALDEAGSFVLSRRDGP